MSAVNTPKPTALHKELPFSHVERHWVDGCPHYPTCSRTVAATRWVAWTCARCPLFPGGPWLEEGVDPDLAANPFGDSPPPVVAGLDDLAVVIVARCQQEKRRVARRPTAKVIHEQECVDCLRVLPAKSMAWRCTKCGHLACSICAEDHVCYPEAEEYLDSTE